MKASSFLYFARFGIRSILLRKKEPILGTIILTDKCNLHCKHCSVNNITAVVHPYQQIQSEMCQLYEMGIRILFFCGGETFLWRDSGKTLRDLVIEAKQIGFLIVNIVTNGTFPLDLPEADLILLSLDGDRERHNAIRGDTYDLIFENIRQATADKQECHPGSLHRCQGYQKRPGCVLQLSHALSGYRGSDSVQRREGNLLSGYIADDGPGRPGIQSEKRLPLPDPQPFPNTVLSMRCDGKRKTQYLWTVYRDSWPVRAVRIVLCGGVHAAVPWKSPNHFRDAADLSEIHIGAL